MLGFYFPFFGVESKSQLQFDYIFYLQITGHHKLGVLVSLKFGSMLSDTMDLHTNLVIKSTKRPAVVSEDCLIQVLLNSQLF